ncbi:MAG: type I glyceraldehyde-3-phosphate dehydrogenase, partial [Chloroflexi bacterium]|nr:type I glyceraldehyde-3-phosphate dehydrogenase [Chloroflexota bacterium]
MARVGINGFGRIGRQVLRALHEQHPDELQVVAVNDLADVKTNAHLFKYDSNYGVFPGKVAAGEHAISLNGQEVRVFAERDPGKIPWRDLGVDIVVESTGVFTDANRARAHIEGGGAKKVIISAPARNEDLTLVLGVNDHQYDPGKHHIISNASCTTNCIATVVKVLHDNFTIQRGLMSTVHSYTNDQRILDQVHDDLRRARAAALNIIPTTTGAARAVGVVLPKLKGKLDGIAARVPVSDGSVVDLVVQFEQRPDRDAINEAVRKAAEGPLKGVLEYSEVPLVSSDIISNPHSSIFDSLLTQSK